MSQNITEKDCKTRSCPSCGSEIYQQGAPGTYWCDQCKREFWKEGDLWWSCDESGEPERVEVAADGGSESQLSGQPLYNATVELESGGSYDGKVTIEGVWVRIERANVARWFPARKVSKIKEPSPV